MSDKTSLETFHNQAQELTGENVGIFVDYDNMYHCLRDFGADIESEEADVIEFLWNCYTRDKIRTFKAYADFDQVQVSMRNLQLNRVQIKQVYGNGKEEKYRKNASDIELSIDALESTYHDSSIDTYVFVTADSDMIPIMSRMIYKGKKVHLYYIGTNVSQYQDITKYSHYNQDFLTVFNIDKDRANANYWVEKVCQHIREWYDDSKNKNNMYGGTWLRDGLIKTFSMSKSLASSVIEHLETEKNIIKYKNPKNNRDGYIVADDLFVFETKFGENGIKSGKTPVTN